MHRKGIYAFTFETFVGNYHWGSIQKTLFLIEKWHARLFRASDQFEYSYLSEPELFCIQFCPQN